MEVPRIELRSELRSPKRTRTERTCPGAPRKRNAPIEVAGDTEQNPVGLFPTFDTLMLNLANEEGRDANGTYPR
jgi:hypothetical protein